MKPLTRFVLVLATLVAAVAPALAADVPVVVLLDSSRSVKPPQFAAITAKIGESLRGLPLDSPVALMEFNDAPNWVVPMAGSPAAVAEAVARVKPGGNHSLLLDAIATAVRDLPAGGLVLLLTDGKDEGSVSTVADIGALCNVRHVRVYTVAVGPAPNLRTMQRLALLTGGKHLGAIEKLAAAQVNQALATGRQEVVAGLPAPLQAPASAPVPVQPTAAATAAVAAAQAAAAPTAEPEPVGPVQEGPSLLLPGLGILALIVVVVAFMVWRSKKAGSERVCTECNLPMATWESSCSNCAIERLQLRQAESSREAAPPAEPVAPEVEFFDPTEFSKLPTEERLEKTFNLEEHAVLIIRQQRRPVRTFALDPSKVIHAGRAATVNTVAIDDPSVSAQHFKIVPKESEFYILDLDSTNGTYVNGERIKVRKLKSGDAVMAGQVECEFRMQFVRRS